MEPTISTGQNMRASSKSTRYLALRLEQRRVRVQLNSLTEWWGSKNGNLHLAFKEGQAETLP